MLAEVKLPVASGRPSAFANWDCHDKQVTHLPMLTHTVGGEEEEGGGGGLLFSCLSYFTSCDFAVVIVGLVTVKFSFEVC